jgi:hypothetical protein
LPPKKKFLINIILAEKCRFDNCSDTKPLDASKKGLSYGFFGGVLRKKTFSNGAFFERTSLDGCHK